MLMKRMSRNNDVLTGQMKRIPIVQDRQPQGAAVHLVLDKLLKVRNRITWEREKGRGAKRNFKIASEDIWFATVSDDYVFNLADVKLKRRVIAPYTDASGKPKDWQNTSKGHFRLTHPSNLWNDITVPFWSMPENTDHPTQKPEKLMAKLILASTNEGDFVLDPFMGVGSSLVAAKKLNRRFFGVEIETEYCLLAAKRLHLAEQDKTIQGYHDGFKYVLFNDFVDEVHAVNGGPDMADFSLLSGFFQYGQKLEGSIKGLLVFYKMKLV